MARLECPETTSNNLADVLLWIKMGDCVVLVTDNGKYMPYCQRSVFSEDPKTYRTIYVDISAMPALGNSEEWPWYILNNGGVFCTDELMQKHILGNTHPNCYRLSLGI